MKSKINTSSFGPVLAGARLLALPALLCLTSGCVHSMRMNVKPTALAASDKYPGRVALVLDKDFTHYTHTMKMMGDSFVSAMGPPLQDYAKSVTEHLFSEVPVYPTAAEAAG